MAFQNCNVNNEQEARSEIVDLNCAGDLKNKACQFYSAFHKNMW